MKVSSALMIFGLVILLVSFLGSIPSWLTFAGLISFCIGGLSASVIQEKEEQDNFLRQLKSVKGFNLTSYILGADKKSGVAIDEKASKVCLIAGRRDMCQFTVIPHTGILSSEVFEDGNTITKHSTSRSSQIQGALLGGLVLGGPGAIIGGLSGKQTSSTSNVVRKVDLRLIVDIPNKPIHDVSFLCTPCDRDGLLDGSIYNQALKSARHWHGLMSILMRKADMERDNSINDIERKEHGTISNVNGVSEEILKLAKLRDQGVLSEQEFESIKKNIIHNFSRT
jgi:hypothetical protein